jgi:hypothetical protein
MMYLNASSMRAARSERTLVIQGRPGHFTGGCQVDLDAADAALVFVV